MNSVTVIFTYYPRVFWQSNDDETFSKVLHTGFICSRCQKLPFFNILLYDTDVTFAVFKYLNIPAFNMSLATERGVENLIAI